MKVLKKKKIKCIMMCINLLRGLWLIGLYLLKVKIALK